MLVNVDGEEREVEVGYIKQIKQDSVVFITKEKEIEIKAEPNIIEQIFDIHANDDEALIPLDTHKKEIIFNSNPIY